MDKNTKEIFVALKLIECLYKKGKLEERVYKNIRKEYVRYLPKTA